MTSPDAIDIRNADGTTNVVHQYRPKAEATCVVVIFPALGVLASYYQLLAEELASQGMVAITADLRGNGQSSIRPSKKVDFSYTDLLHQDYTSIMGHVCSAHAGKKTLLLGHSLGGQLSCLFASRRPHRIDGIILTAACSVFYKAWPGMKSYQLLAGTQLIRLIANTVGYFPGKKIGFGGTEAKSLMRDWSRQARTGNYVLAHDDFDYEKALKKVSLPILAISFEEDTYAPKEAVNHLLNKMLSASIEHVHLSSTDPRNAGFNHFNWARKPKNIVEIIARWTASLP